MPDRPAKPTTSTPSPEIADLQHQIKLTGLRRQRDDTDALLRPLQRPSTTLSPEELVQKRDLELKREEIMLHIREIELPTEIIAAEFDCRQKEFSAKSPEAIAALEIMISRRRAGQALGSGRSGPEYTRQLLQDLKRKNPREEARAQLEALATQAQAHLAKVEAERASIPPRQTKISQLRAELKQQFLAPAVEPETPNRTGDSTGAVRHGDERKAHRKSYTPEEVRDAIQFVRTTPHAPNRTAMRALNISEAEFYRWIKNDRLRKYKRGFVYSAQVVQILDRGLSEQQKRK